MVDAAEKRQMTPRGLVGAIEEFIGDNKRSVLVEHRWLADWLDETLRVARQVRSGNSLDPKYRELVAEFRLAEIDKAKSEHQKEIDDLDREARKIAVEKV
jgi:hypothetical protein